MMPPRRLSRQKMAGAVPAAIRVTPANSAQSAEVQSRRNGIVPPAELRAIRASSVLNAELRNLKHGIAPNAVPRESRVNSALNADIRKPDVSQ